MIADCLDNERTPVHPGVRSIIDGVVPDIEGHDAKAVHRICYLVCEVQPIVARIVCA